jgi:rubredoxin
MLRCPMCGSEDQFEVEEILHHLIIVEVSHEPYDYHVKEEGPIKNIDWLRVTCLACQHEMDEQDARERYELANQEEYDDAPDATPEPGPLAQP